MTSQLKVLVVDAGSGMYQIRRYPVGQFFGPVDLGLSLYQQGHGLSFGIGLLAGSILPGSNRLIFTGRSPCWHGFYISSMGGAGLVFDNLGINLVSLVGKAPSPSVLVLNREHGEVAEVEVEPLDLPRVWQQGDGGIYGLMDYVLDRYGDRYETDPRVLAVGPAAATTDMGAIASAPIKKGELTPVDTWAGRGGFGSKLLQEHGLAGIIFGGTVVDDDFRDRRVADEWFEQRYQKKLIAKDLESTVKYRFDPTFETGGTFGVNYATIGGRVLAFNYRTVTWSEQQRVDLHERFILQHYLRQFNEETIATKSFRHCGEPCPAVCKKLRNEFKKDYEPYQTMGPLCGIFDQRAAERLARHADRLGFDAISVGGALATLMECLEQGLLTAEELGIEMAGPPVLEPEGFALESDSAHNADLGIALLDAIVEQRGIIDLSHGMRRWLRELACKPGRERPFDLFLATASGRGGWMVPNQYWTPGVLSPMPIMGKYYMYYGADFVPPRELGRRNARRLIGELTLDNLGYCRFHRLWAEEMLPDILGSLFDLKEPYLERVKLTAVRLNHRNSSVPWETQRNIDLVESFLRRHHEVEGNRDKELEHWLDRFTSDRQAAALDFWFDMLKGVHETLREPR